MFSVGTTQVEERVKYLAIKIHACYYRWKISLRYMYRMCVSLYGSYVPNVLWNESMELQKQGLEEWFPFILAELIKHN